MARKKHNEEHPDETWLIPYADMLTLLLALFIVMFAMSKLDQAKFKEIANQFNVVFAGGEGLFNEDGDRIIPPVASGSQNKDQMTDRQKKENLVTNRQREEDLMTDIKERIENEIQKQGVGDKVKVELTAEGLEITIQDAVLFNSGDANVMEENSQVLTHIATMISGLDNKVKVIGHTDDRPIKSAKFRSNWDLSAYRAINVMTFLVDAGNLDESRFSIQGYGEYMPRYDNSTAEGRARNRRVEIVIIRKYTDDGKETISFNEAVGHADMGKLRYRLYADIDKFV